MYEEVTKTIKLTIYILRDKNTGWVVESSRRGTLINGQDPKELVAIFRSTRGAKDGIKECKKSWEDRLNYIKTYGSNDPSGDWECRANLEVVRLVVEIPVDSGRVVG